MEEDNSSSQNAEEVSQSSSEDGEVEGSAEGGQKEGEQDGQGESQQDNETNSVDDNSSNFYWSCTETQICMGLPYDPNNKDDKSNNYDTGKDPPIESSSGLFDLDASRFSLGITVSLENNSNSNKSDDTSSPSSAHSSTLRDSSSETGSLEKSKQNLLSSPEKSTSSIDRSSIEKLKVTQPEKETATKATTSPEKMSSDGKPKSISASGNDIRPSSSVTKSPESLAELVRELLNSMLGPSSQNGDTPEKTSMTFPLPKGTYTLSSKFGVPRPKPKNPSRTHSGVDYSAPQGTSVYAAGDGNAIAKQDPRGYGNYVEITHPNGVKTVYGHLKELPWKDKNPRPVKQGDKIGEVGNTGHSTAPHLHFEVRLNNKPIDPRGYIDRL